MASTQLSFRPTSPAGTPPVLSVAQLVRQAHASLDAKFGVVWVEGEVSNLRVGAAGHAFFTLKDDEAMLPVAMWRSNLERLRFRVADGQTLRVCGRVGIFAKQGRFQMYGERAEPAGLGARALALEQRKAKLAAEGLFDPARKRRLPRWPRAVGLVTSAHGAALGDILQVAQRRCPSRFVVAPATVQGPEAPRSLVRALQRLSQHPAVDVIIIGRGGGSAEDLGAFDDERVARAIAACPVPVVSAVGHEIDVTICDLVADVRAATPSQAAELTVPDRAAALAAFAVARQRLRRAILRRQLDCRARAEPCLPRLSAAMRRSAHERRRQLAELERALAGQHPRERIVRDRRLLGALERRLAAAAGPMLARRRQLHAALDRQLLQLAAELLPARRARLSALSSRLLALGGGLVQPARLRIARLSGALQALSPLAVLERGYAVVTLADPSDGASARTAVVTDARDVQPGAPIVVRLRRGTLRAIVEGRNVDEN